MRRTSLAVGVWLLIAAAATACTPNAASEAEAACTTLCRCQVALPATQKACVTDCIGNLAPVAGQLEQQCFECVFEHANECRTITTDCQPRCGGVGGGDDTGVADAAIILVDAGVPPP